MNRFLGRSRCCDEAHGGEDSRARGRPRVGIKAAAKGREGEAGLADAGKILIPVRGLRIGQDSSSNAVYF